MGLFHSDKDLRKTQSTSKKSDALDYFCDEEVVCTSNVDRDTMNLLYEAIVKDNYDTYDDDSLRDAISSLDANLFNLCKALVYQNFMLMRKVDKLIREVEELKE